MDEVMKGQAALAWKAITNEMLLAKRAGMSNKELAVFTDRQAVILIEKALRAAYADGQRDGMERAAKRFDKLFAVTDTRIDRVRDYRCDEFYKWLMAATTKGE